MPAIWAPPSADTIAHWDEVREGLKGKDYGAEIVATIKGREDEKKRAVMDLAIGKTWKECG